jgi:hypothetical protein
MTRATGVESLTGIRELRRNITGGPGATLRSPGRLSVDALRQAGRTLLRVGQTSSKAVRQVVAALQPARWTEAEVPSVAWTEVEAQRVIPAAAAVPAGRACHPEVDVEVAVSAVVEDPVAAVDSVAAAAAAAAEAVVEEAVAVVEEAADSCPC